MIFGVRMKKADEFSKVLDLLGNGEKDKLLTSAKGLMRAQKVVRINSTKTKPLKKKQNLQKDKA